MNGTSAAMASVTPDAIRTRRAIPRSSFRLCLPARRYPVRVEHRLHVAKPGYALLELSTVADLDDETVAHHWVLRGAVGLEDVHARLREGPRQVLKEAAPVPRIDLELDSIGGAVVTGPGNLGEALRRLAQGPDVLAILAVDRDAAAERDVADDLVAGHRAAAFCEPNHDVVDALHLDPVIGSLLGAALALVAAFEHSGEARLGLVAGDGLARLQPLQQLVRDCLRRDLRPPERDVEVVGLAEAHLSDHVREDRRAGDLLRRQPALFQLGLEGLAAAVLRVLAALALEESADLVSGAGRLHDRQPVARWTALLLRREDLHDVARLQLVVEWHDLPVHLRADAPVADVGVDRVREVERRRAGGEVLHLALRREDEDLVLEEVDLQRLQELLRLLLALGLEQLAQPRHLLPLRVLVRPRRGFLVEHVRCHAVLGQLVHVRGPDLDLERPALGPDHGRVQGLVEVRLRGRNEVLEPARQRLPDRVDDADRAVAVLDRVHDHAHGGEVVDLVELAALLGHLRIDRVEVLGPAGDRRLDPDLLELAREEAAGVADVRLALRPLLGDELLDLRVLARVQGREREVLQLPLDRVNP